ncbi:PadR family transcriptional regulator [Litoribacterium kuwaitense]|uniref:PadR family transcriptional regulator n=1 Tax=Litoribacterium kuwaitense TaxID=1398745 RepID=UPI001BAAABAB|nr:PadR family transcriptional regulator [Litoribacterium kuwaitense]
MKPYNHTTYALLGILTTDYRTGYEMKQLIDHSLNHFWKISYGQIYPTLKKLVQDELATVKTTTQSGKPARKEYTITDKGRNELLAWLEEPLEHIPAHRNEVLLKLFFSRHQQPEQTLSLLNDYMDILQRNYDTYEGIEQMITRCNESPDVTYWLYTLDYGKRITKATLEWCQVTIEHLKESTDKC